MPRKAITFLGIGNYQETTYTWQGEQCTTLYMAEATARIFAPDELLVLLTTEAEAKDYAALVQRLAGTVPIRKLSIPNGRSETELWEIFSVIAEAVDPGDSLIFDITSSYRSLPVLALLAASFLRTVREATVERMIYGAFEARENNVSPIFDLTPFIALLDWTTATEAFLRYGRADDLAEQVRNSVHSVPSAPANNDSRIADQLATLTRALQTVRTAEVMESADRLDQLLQQRRNDTENDPPTAPFTMLLDQITDGYAHLALADPMDPANSNAVLQRKLAMVYWYLQKAMPVQAITLSREWLVSLVVARRGQELFDRSHRVEAEDLLNARVQAAETDPIHTDLPRMQKIWIELAGLRNDVAHTGMRPGSAHAQKVFQRADKIYEKLQQLLILLNQRPS